MRYLSLSVIILLAGCREASTTTSEPSTPEINSSELLEKFFQNQKKVIFYSTRPGPHINGSCKLELHDDSTCYFSSYAYNFIDLEGVYKIRNNNIEILLDYGPKRSFFVNAQDKFPLLVLNEENGYLILKRKDGRGDFREHWNVYEFPGDQAHPIFPLTTKPITQ